jgi:hypothetical protein
MNTLSFVTASCLVLAASPALSEEKFRASLNGYNEVPSVSTPSRGSFEASVGRDGVIDYELSYRGLQGTVTQSHIHFAQRHVNGAIVVWLCQTATNPAPAGTNPPTCPPSTDAGVTVRGEIRASDVLGTAPAQQMPSGSMEELLDALRAGAAYVNVHSSITPTGEIRGQVGDRGRGRGHEHRH